MDRWHTARAISWNDSKKEKKGKVIALFVASAISLAVMSPGMRAEMADSAQRMVSVIVRALPGQTTEVRDAVEDAGGNVGRQLGIIGGFEARVPEAAVARLEALPSVYEITPNAKLQFTQLNPANGLSGLITDNAGNGTLEVDTDDSTASAVARMPGSMYKTSKVTGAKRYHERGIYGQGVDVAMIDTGVVPVDGLPANRVINGPDLSFESQYEEIRYLDTMGHGTHMAGIIMGSQLDSDARDGNRYDFQGIAPQSRLVNIKVGQADGAADVSQVIAAIDWVVQYGRTNGLNIRILNLSFGTDGVQDYMLDPLTFAVENAWHHGIVVVVAAGNAGFGSPKLNNPAYDPYVIAVGASDSKGTIDVNDDVVPEWSSRGNAERRPDVVAPGQSVVSLRAEGSLIDEEYPAARVGTRYFKGSGTSQSAAVVTGAVALMLSHRPDLTPDQVKATLMRNARALPNADAVAQGAGLLNLRRLGEGAVVSAAEATQTFPRATGTGSLEAARGSIHVAELDGNGDGIEDDPIELVGEFDIFGMPFDGRSWSLLSAAGRSWSGGSWNGSELTGDCFCGSSWSGRSWSGRSWSGRSWSGRSWSGRSWSGRSWSGRSWSGRSWSGRSWSAVSYS